MLKVFLIILAVILFLGIFAICLVSFIRFLIREKRNKGGIHLGYQNKILENSETNEIAGIKGEIRICEDLRRILKEDEYIFTNILLPIRNNHTTELDAVIVSRKGIFCIEIKTWIGRITGNDKDEYWLQEYADPSLAPRQHKNPVLQNDRHCARLEKLLKRDDVYCIVLLAVLEEDNIDSKYTYTFNGFKNFYNELNDDELTIEEINAISNKLKQFIPNLAQMEKHKSDVNKMHPN